MTHFRASSSTRFAVAATSYVRNTWRAALERLSAVATPPRSLSARLTAWFLACSLFLIVLTALVLWWATENALRSADEQVLLKRAEALHSVIADGTFNDGLISHEVNEELTGPRQVFVRLIGASGETYDETDKMSRVIPRSLFPTLFGQSSFAQLKTPEGKHFLVYSMRAQLGGGVPDVLIQAAADTTYDQQALAVFRQILAAVIGIGVLLGAFIGRSIVRRELAPLESVTAATSRIDQKNLEYRLDLDGLPNELQSLGQQFNGMLARLETAYFGLQHYADNVAHEIRGPVNRMLLGAEVSLAKSRSPEAYREALEANMEECQQLKHIIERLLFLARAENAKIVLECSPVDITKEISSIRDLFAASAEDAGVKLAVSGDQRLVASVDRVLFQRALSNLVTNAISHTPPGGQVEIGARRENAGIAIAVSDTGEGIAPEVQKHVFDRFYRADGVRNSSSGRVGLGLPITKSIVELHGGTISLESEPRHGTTLTLRFPESQAVAA